MSSPTRNKGVILLFELVLFSIYGAIMLVSKFVFHFLPNIHLLAMFIAVFTYVYRVKALIPIYVFVFLYGVTVAFDVWWVPYLYIWTILWAMCMIIPKKAKFAAVLFPIVCSLHGFLYGILYSPFQALAFGFDLKMTVAWIISGIPFDLIHGISNFALGFLVVPLASVIEKAHKAL